MQVSILDLLRHMQDEINFVLHYTGQKEKEEVVADEVLCRAVIRSIEIMGEAARKLNDSFKAEYPHIEWRKMAGTRDRLIHHYFGVDYDIVWEIITEKMPFLQRQITSILSQA